MALVNVVNMVVLDNPTCFLNPFQFEITFECLQELQDDLEWKVLYVGSAHDAHQDQILDEILVGPVPVGLNKFVLQADPPNSKQLMQNNNLLGVTVVLVTCSYRESEFVRVGYYVNNEYTGEYDPEVGPPSNPELTFVQREILADKPRVTKFPIAWDDDTVVAVDPSSANHNHQTTTMNTDLSATAAATGEGDAQTGGVVTPSGFDLQHNSGHGDFGKGMPSSPVGGDLLHTPSTTATNESMLMMDLE